jgi:DNA-binding response OmpR family regulator
MEFLIRLKNLFRSAPPPPELQPFEPLVESSNRRGKERRVARAGTRVLLIDDSATIVALLRRMLRQNEYLTLEAGDAERGIELARSERPDLIFLDIVLPGMNGFAALRALRRDPDTKDIPIIMISGNEQATEEFYVHRIGADDFMKKPFSRGEVFARIERLLDEEGVPRRVPAAEATGETAAATPA